jgi:hypothetical protein
MLKILIAVVLKTFAVYKPAHVMQTEDYSCGATDRLAKESISLKLTNEPENVIYVNYTKWQLYDGEGTGEYRWRARFQADPRAHMSMTLDFNEDDAYLSIQGIDAKRRPCKDAVYLKRVK